MKIRRVEPGVLDPTLLFGNLPEMATRWWGLGTLIGACVAAPPPDFGPAEPLLSSLPTYEASVRPGGTFVVAPRIAPVGLWDPVGRGPNPAFEIGTRSLARGGRALAETPSEFRRTGRGLERLLGPANESVTFDAHGVEQAWTFAEEPLGRGDLRIELEISAEHVLEDGRGHHFADRASGLGIRYGAATWVDRDGARTPIAVTYEADRLILTVSARLLEASPYPAVLDPYIYPEFQTDDLLLAPFPGHDQDPEVGFGAETFFVAWNRDGIRAGRITLDGQHLDPSGIVLQAAGGGLRKPDVASDGSNFLVVWEGIGDPGLTAVYGTLVAPDGTPVMPTPLSFGQGDSFYHPRAAFGNDRYLIVYEATSDLYGLLVDRLASPVGSPFPITTAYGYQGAAQVAWDGMRFHVAWVNYDYGPEVRVARIAEDGTVLDPEGTRVSTELVGSSAATIACGAGSCLATWLEGLADSPYPPRFAVKGVRIASTGEILDAPAVDFGTAIQCTMAAGFDGIRYLTGWIDPEYDLVAVRVTPSGTVLDSTPFQVAPSSTEQSAPSLACASTACLFGYQNYIAGYDAFAARVAADGTPLDPGGLIMDGVQSGQRWPAAAKGAAATLLAWTDRRDSSPRIFATRVQAEPSEWILDPDGIGVSVAGPTATSPDVSFDGTNWLVAWADDAAVKAARIDASGIRLDSPFVVEDAATQQTDVATTFGAGHHLVVWTQFGASGRDLHAARIAPDGTLAAPGAFPVATDPPDEVLADAASDGASYLVVWQAGSGDSAQIMGARISGSTVGAVFPISVGSSVAAAPAVAFDGTRYLVVWEDRTSGIWTIVGKRVDVSGTVLDGTRLPISVTATEDKRRPNVAFDGTDFFVTWQDPRGHPLLGGVYRARGVWVGGDGTLLSEEVALGDAEYISSRPAVAGIGTDQVLAASDTFNGFPDASRLHLTVARRQELPLGASCSRDGDCTSGHCVDRVCCDATCGGGNPGDCLACAVRVGAVTDGTCGVALAGTTCRPARTGCDVAEACNGAASICPTDVLAGDGTPCSDGDPCTGSDKCLAGSCLGTARCLDAGTADAGLPPPDARPPPDAWPPEPSDAAGAADAMRPDAAGPDAIHPDEKREAGGCRLAAAQASLPGWPLLSFFLILMVIGCRPRR